MAKDVFTIDLVMRVLTDVRVHNELDTYVTPIVWSPPTPVRFCVCVRLCLQDRKLRIGYFSTEPWFPAVPAVRRAVDVAVNVLKQRGHEMVCAHA
jgi:hypothetical protein